MAAICVAIATIDVLQVIALGKGLGAIGGAFLYGTYAFGLVRQRDWAAWATSIMPVVPLAVIAGLLGPELREDLVDRPMLAVAVLQVVAALGAGGLLFAARFRRTR